MNVNIKKWQLFLVYGCLLLCSCSKSKEECIYEYQDFVSSVRENHNSYSQKDWVQADLEMDYYHEIIKRYEHELSQEERNAIIRAFEIYHSYRNTVGSPLTVLQDDTTIPPSPPTDSDNVVDDKADEERAKREEKLQKKLDETSSRLEQIEKRLTDTERKQALQTQKTERERIEKAAADDALIHLLKEKQREWRVVSGNMMVVIIPTNLGENLFHMNVQELSPIIDSAVNIIHTQAKRYNWSLSITWFFRKGAVVSLRMQTEGLNEYNSYKKFSTYSGINYNHIATVYVVDKEGRSVCWRRGELGKNETNAIFWFKDGAQHTDGTLAHELFHTLGADDLYYEEGKMTETYKKDYKKYCDILIGDSIMRYSDRTLNIDPFSAWRMGWKKNPEPWYYFFLTSRNPHSDLIYE